MARRLADLSDEELSQEWPYLSRDQIEEFKNAFKVFDRRKVGMFTIDDVSWVMKMLGQKASPAELEAIIKDLDVDGDGVIDLAEFMVMMMSVTEKGEPEQDLKDVFAVFDKSGNGSVTRDELREALKGLGDAMSEREIDDLFTLADKSGNGVVEFDEFIAFVLGDEFKSATHRQRRLMDPDAAGTPVAMAAPAAAASHHRADAAAEEQPGSSRQHAAVDLELELAAMQARGQGHAAPPWEVAAAAVAPSWGPGEASAMPEAASSTSGWGGGQGRPAPPWQAGPAAPEPAAASSAAAWPGRQGRLAPPWEAGDDGTALEADSHAARDHQHLWDDDHSSGQAHQTPQNGTSERAAQAGSPPAQAAPDTLLPVAEESRHTTATAEQASAAALDNGLYEGAAEPAHQQRDATAEPTADPDQQSGLPSAQQAPETPQHSEQGDYFADSAAPQPAFKPGRKQPKSVSLQQSKSQSKQLHAAPKSNKSSGKVRLPPLSSSEAAV